MLRPDVAVMRPFGLFLGKRQYLLRSLCESLERIQSLLTPLTLGLSRGVGLAPPPVRSGRPSEESLSPNYNPGGFRSHSRSAAAREGPCRSPCQPNSYPFPATLTEAAGKDPVETTQPRPFSGAGLLLVRVRRPVLPTRPLRRSRCPSAPG